MGFECGIVGLPNVGKSTLFNALTATAAAEAANYPFTTVEPNTGVVAVPDERLERVAALAGSPRATPTTLRFVDIAGLVRGASRGEGLGNRFLAQIREVDAICHVVRCFDDGGVAHIEGAIDPIRDAETVDTELMLADLESLERRVEAATKRARGGDAEAKEQLAVMQPALAVLGDGRPARAAAVPEHRREAFRALQLLTAKPVLYVCNVAEAEAATGNAWSEAIARRAAAEGAGAVVISVEIEAEVAQLDDAAERQEYLAALGLAETGLARPRPDCRTCATPISVRQAGRKAGTTGFTNAERSTHIAYDDLVACGGEQAAKDAGRMHLEGRDYVVRDGDVIRFRFNV
jgi:GTP-binding protein YchF